jgi:rhodanese-related sulfurtransferase
MQQGWVLLDVRPPNEVARVSIEGAVAVPLFLPETRNDVASLMKRASTWGTGGWWLGGTHMIPNPDFMAEVRRAGAAARPRAAAAAGACARACARPRRATGGASPRPLRRGPNPCSPAPPPPDPATARVPMDARVIVGCQRGLRSLAACEQLCLAGYTTLAWVNGGFDTAEVGDLPTQPGGKDIRWVARPGRRAAAGLGGGAGACSNSLGPDRPARPTPAAPPPPPPAGGPPPPPARPPPPPPPPGPAPRFAGIGGLSEALGWTEVQQQYNQGFMGGSNTVLKVGGRELGGTGPPRAAPQAAAPRAPGARCTSPPSPRDGPDLCRPAPPRPRAPTALRAQLVGIFLVLDLLLIGLDYVNSVRTGTPFVF